MISPHAVAAGITADVEALADRARDAEAEITRLRAQVASLTVPKWTDAEMDAWSESERTGTDEGHEHCPDCGCDPEDHTLHVVACRRCGTDQQCPPWRPWMEPSGATTPQTDQSEGRS